jgi:aminomethyltransferase
MIRARDLSQNGKLELGGPDRGRFLQGMVSNEVLALAPGQGCRASMLTVKGKLLGDLRIWIEESLALVETDQAASAAIKDALEKHIIMDDVQVADRTAELGEVALWGEGVAAALGGALGVALDGLPLHGHRAAGGARAFADHDFGAASFRLIAPPGEIARIVAAIGAAPVGDEEAEILRIEAGEPRYGRDMGPDHLPIESRLDQTISFTKGCYLGQEVIVRATQQGRINRKLVGLALDGGRAAAAGARLSGPGRDEAGSVTSSAVSPRFGAIALGYVHRTLWAPGTELALHEGEGTRRAVVRELPFS